jgi:hypothetical protein
MSYLPFADVSGRLVREDLRLGVLGANSEGVVSCFASFELLDITLTMPLGWGVGVGDVYLVAERLICGCRYPDMQ